LSYLPLKSSKGSKILPLIISMVHWRHRLYGVDAPAAWSSEGPVAKRNMCTVTVSLETILSGHKNEYVRNKFNFICTTHNFKWDFCTSLTSDRPTSTSSPRLALRSNSSSFMPAVESVNYVTELPPVRPDCPV